jgi:hypothetical protein
MLGLDFLTHCDLLDLEERSVGFLDFRRERCAAAAPGFGSPLRAVAREGRSTAAGAFARKTARADRFEIEAALSLASVSPFSG